MIAMVFAVASAVGSEMFNVVTQGYPHNATGNCQGIEDLKPTPTECRTDLSSGSVCELALSNQPAYAQGSEGFCSIAILRQP